MFRLSISLVLIFFCQGAIATSVFTTPFKSIDDTKPANAIKERSQTVADLTVKINQIRRLLEQILPEIDSIDDIRVRNLIKNELLLPNDTTLDSKDKNQLVELLSDQLSRLELQRISTEAERDNRGNKCPQGEFCKIVFSPEQEGFGDIALNPFGDGVDYKLNVLNYSIYAGDNVKIPFQLFIAEVSDEDDGEEKNNKNLLDPTSGIAFQLPYAFRYGGTETGICQFKLKNGHCIIGGDLTLRYVELEELTGTDGNTDPVGTFGISIGFGASLMFPIFVDKITDQAGHLSVAAKLRYYYHDHDDPDVLFGPVLDGNGNPIEFEDDFAAASIAGEFAINDKFVFKLEYFKPLSNDDYLSDESTLSFVFRGF